MSCAYLLECSQMVLPGWTGKTPNEIAAGLDCHPQTYGSIAMRLSGQRFATADEIEQATATVFRSFVSRMVRCAETACNDLREPFTSGLTSAPRILAAKLSDAQVQWGSLAADRLIVRRANVIL